MTRSTFTDTERDFLLRMRVARLATVGRDHGPHVIPIVYALEAGPLYTPLDHKAKRVPLTQLKRVRNIIANPQVAVVVDQYDEDWTRLAWVLVRGVAELHESGHAHETGIRLLRDKYPQYRQVPLDQHPLIVITPQAITSWKA
jgi:PPOX class probable F420-dependent enzyme